MNARFQIAIHVLTLLHNSQGELISSDYIAGSLNANPALVRKEISNLHKAGLITSKEGKGGGYSLGKASALITLADIFKTVNSGPILGTSKNQPNPDCPVGRQINKNISSLYATVDETVINRLKTITLANFADQFD